MIPTPTSTSSRAHCSPHFGQSWVSLSNSVCVRTLASYRFPWAGLIFVLVQPERVPDPPPQTLFLHRFGGCVSPERFFDSQVDQRGHPLHELYAVNGFHSSLLSLRRRSGPGASSRANLLDRSTTLFFADREQTDKRVRCLARVVANFGGINFHFKLLSLRRHDAPFRVDISRRPSRPVRSYCQEPAPRSRAKRRRGPCASPPCGAGRAA